MGTEPGRRHHVLIPLLILAAGGLGAFLILLWSTPFGAGISPDSVVYIDAAQSLLAGDGYRTAGQPLTHFPPVYPTLLAAAGLPGGDPLAAARWLHTFLFSFNVALVGAIAYAATKESVMASLCAILLFLSSARLLYVHNMAWSEPPFLLFSLTALLLLALHLTRPSIGRLLGSAFALALALATRYAGLTLLPAMVLAVLLLDRRGFKTRVRDSLVLVGIGATPLALWLLRNALVADSATDRTLAFHPVNLGHALTFLNTLYDMWLPINAREYFRIPQVLFVLTGGLVLLGFWLVIRGEFRSRDRVSAGTAWLWTTVLFGLSYVLFLALSISFVDAHTPLDFRILSPLYVLGVIFVVTVAWRVSDARNNRTLWRGFLVLALVLVGLNAGRAVSLARQLHEAGTGFMDRTWRASESVAYVRSLPEDTILYSNGPDLLRILTGKEVGWIPYKVFPTSLEPDPDLIPQMRALHTDLVQRGARIVYLDNIFRSSLPSREELEGLFEMPVLLRLQDGTVYGVEEPR